VTSLRTIAALLALLVLVVGLGAGLGRVSRGLVRARRPAHASWLGLAAAGLALRAAVEVADLPGGVALLIVSYGLLLAACLRNLAWTGVGIVAIGLGAMVVPTVLNGGMSVRASAVRSVGAFGLEASDPLPAGASLPGERHVETSEDRLPWLGDVVPVPGAGIVVSFGLLVALVGLGDVAFNATARQVRRRSPAALLSPLLGPDADVSTFGRFDHTDGYTVVRTIDPDEGLTALYEDEPSDATPPAAETSSRGG